MRFVIDKKNIAIPFMFLKYAPVHFFALLHICQFFQQFRRKDLMERGFPAFCLDESKGRLISGNRSSDK